MIKELIQIANDLDKKGLIKEADYLDSIITKVANTWIPAGPTTVTLSSPPPPSVTAPTPGVPSVPNTVVGPARSVVTRVAPRVAPNLTQSMVAGTTVTRVVLPVAAIAGLILIGIASAEAYEASEEGDKATDRVTSNIVKSAIGTALISALGELSKSDWPKEGRLGLSDMKRAQLQWRRGDRLDTRGQEALAELASVASQIGAFKQDNLNAEIGKAQRSSYKEYVDIPAIERKHKEIIEPLKQAASAQPEKLYSDIDYSS